MPKSRGWRVCSVSGCPEYTQQGKCNAHRAEADQRRGSARQRGYDHEHETRFREPVLKRDPTCVCGVEAHGHGSPCGQPSRHADHHPLDRRALTAAGLDPNDPQHGRGLCGPCHSSHTAREQPGGWHA
ncbi:holin [Streptomyces sp. AK08-02]|uniref:holin n=1 Tax=Streptomyces sp. AK08-02 TaxID=3028654 RepID=UPI0029B10422|nr:holin [Streptomyces sp. AK08-02]MDX3748719.1 holin [Streptomyces sp. AK08-02]